MAASGSALYVGGAFQFDWGSATIRHVFTASGSTLDALGTGLSSGTDGVVDALARHAFDPLFGSVLIAGGLLSEAGGTGVSNVASYTLTGGWSGLGSGLNGTVR